MENYYIKAKEFAAKNIDPIRNDIDEQGYFPIDTFRLLGEEGFFKLIIPIEHGGDGLWLNEHTQVVKAFSESSPSFALCYMMHNVALSYIVKYGTDELKEIIFTDIIENNEFCALAGTEGGTGVHMSKSQFRAEIKEDKAKLTGSKHMVTGGGYAKWYMLVAPKDETSDEVIQWFISKDLEGITFKDNQWNGIGMRANHSVPMIFENVEVDISYSIDASNKEQDYPLIISFIFFLSGLAAVSTGISISLFNETKKHVTERTYPNGNALIDFETVQFHLSDLYSLAHSSDSVLKTSVSSINNKSEGAVDQLISSRIIASQNAIQSANIAMKLGGGKSYNKMNAIERFMRDSYAGQVMTPSLDVLKVNLGASFKN